MLGLSSTVEIHLIFTIFLFTNKKGLSQNIKFIDIYIYKNEPTNNESWKIEIL